MENEKNKPTKPRKPKVKIKKRKRKRKRQLEDLPLPTKNIETIAKSLKKKLDLEVRERKYAPVKDVLTLLAAGTLLAGSVVIPGLAVGLKFFINEEDRWPDAKEWKKFNHAYLARTIRRLEKQKLVEIQEEEDLKTIKITERGRKRVLKYALEELEIKKPKFWNGKWYFITYDIPKNKTWQRNIMRDFLKRLNFYRFHESLYIHAYPCQDEIEFLREYLGLGKYVKLLVVNKIENDRVFREYFGV